MLSPKPLKRVCATSMMFQLMQTLFNTCPGPLFPLFLSRFFLHRVLLTFYEPQKRFQALTSFSQRLFDLFSVLITECILFVNIIKIHRIMIKNTYRKLQFVSLCSGHVTFHGFLSALRLKVSNLSDEVRFPLISRGCLRIFSSLEISSFHSIKYTQIFPEVCDY